MLAGVFINIGLLYSIQIFHFVSGHQNTVFWIVRIRSNFCKYDRKIFWPLIHWYCTRVVLNFVKYEKNNSIILGYRIPIKDGGIIHFKRNTTGLGVGYVFGIEINLFFCQNWTIFEHWGVFWQIFSKKYWSSKACAPITLSIISSKVQVNMSTALQDPALFSHKILNMYMYNNIDISKMVCFDSL